MIHVVNLLQYKDQNSIHLLGHKYAEYGVIKQEYF